MGATLTSANLPSGTSSWDILERENRVRSALATAGICALLLLLFFFLGFYTPYPPPAEEGLLVDFGNTATGFGQENPSTQPQAAAQPEAEAQKSPDGAVDQNLEESVALPKPSEKKEPVKKPVEKPKPVQESKPVVKEPEPDPKPAVDERFVFNKEKHDFKSNSGSQGNTKGSGNMGDPSGGKSDNYLGQNSGLGDKGISFGLSGRGMVGPPPTDNAHQEYGDIKITIQVNKNGQVIDAQYSRQGSTITDRALIDKYVAYARKARFNADPDAPDVQQGFITFKLTLR